MASASEMENHLSSASAFVQGGIQDACDDDCSICLEAFCSDPSTVTGCKHEFHLQCILEWCQRSSHCPMCWQIVSLEDPASQELLEAVEYERITGRKRAQTTTMGRAHHIARREGQVRSGSHGRSQYSVFSTTSNAPSVPHPSPGGVLPEAADGFPVQATQFPLSTSGTNSNPSGRSISNPRTPIGHSPPARQGTPWPSESQPFSKNLKSRWNAVSMRYKDSIVKNTRGWRDRLSSRSSSMADIGSGVKREVHAVTRMMERLDTRGGRRTSSTARTSAEVDAVSRSWNRAMWISLPIELALLGTVAVHRLIG